MSKKPSTLTISPPRGVSRRIWLAHFERLRQHFAKGRPIFEHRSRTQLEWPSEHWKDPRSPIELAAEALERHKKYDHHLDTFGPDYHLGRPR